MFKKLKISNLHVNYKNKISRFINVAQNFKLHHMSGFHQVIKIKH